MSKTISLKEDKMPKRTRLYIGGPETHLEYFFEKGHGIDCFHRLNIPEKALNVLYKIAEIQDKEKAADSDDIDEIIEEETKLWEEYHGIIYDPYKLDIERADNYINIAFILHDYDYEYELVNYKDGWGISCRLSFHKDSLQPYVDMDEPDSFPEDDE